jgi:hypothetical protein
MHHPAHAPTEAAAFSRSYTGHSGQVRCVRADLRPLLDGCPVADGVILCASELAANAALHSHSGRLGAQFTVRAEIHHGDYWDLSTPGLREAWTAGDRSPFHGWDRRPGEPAA